MNVKLTEEFKKVIRKLSDNVYENDIRHLTMDNTDSDDVNDVKSAIDNAITKAITEYEKQKPVIKPFKLKRNP